MINLKLVVGLGMGMCLLTACAHRQKEDPQFIRYAATLPPIVVPPGIENPTGESYYPVPPVAMTAPLGTIPPLVPPGSHLAVQKNVKLPAPQ